MKKPVIKVMSLSLAALLALGGTGVYALAASGGEGVPAAAAAPLVAASPKEGPVRKDETVYVLANAEGSVERIIVSDWLQNTAGSDTISDVSALTGVENVKSEAGFTTGSGDARIWDAQGEDVYYQGGIEKELPVELAVTYTLDGTAVSPAELAGKSGRVTIRFDYINRQYEMAEVNGQMEKIYVPFAMLTGVLLDNDIFRNVEVSNGRLYNDGDRTIVVGAAFPGLQENLDLDSEKLEIPSYVEIRADVEGFELGTTFTAAVSDIFSQLEDSDLEDTGDLQEALGEMTDAMDRLMDGSSELHQGLCTLLERSQELAAGVGALAEGALALRDGADSLAGGAEAIQEGAGSLTDGVSQLQEGALTLSTGLDTLSANSDGLNAGAEQVFQTLLSSADAQLAAAGLELPALTAENYAQVLEGVIAGLPEGAAETIVGLKASLDSYNSFYLGLRSYTAGVADAAAGAQGLYAGIGQLESGVQGLYAGAGELKAGAASFQDGTDRLYEGILTLQGSMPALTEGVAQLRDGALELSNGLEEFNEKGIQKLADAVDGDLENLTARLRATVDAARSYQSFSGISEEMDGQVKFVYRTDSIEG